MKVTNMTKAQLINELIKLKKQTRKLEQGKSKLLKPATKTPDDTKLYKELADSISDIFFAMDKNLRYTFWNKASKKLTGISSKDTIGKTIYELFPDSPETRKAAKIYRQVIKTKEPKKFINEYQLNGKNYIFEINAHPLKNGISVFVRDITERKQLSETLQKSKQLLERTFISLRDAVFVINAATLDIIDCNPAASKIFGYSRKKMLGRTTDFLHVDGASLEKFRANLYPAVEEKGILFLPEFKMKRKNGTVFPTEHSVMPIENKQGKRIGWVSVVRDITERKQVEIALKQSEERYSTMVNSSPNIVLVHKDGVILYINETGSRLLGFSTDELIGKTVFNFLTDDSKELVLKNMQRRLAGEDVESYEVKIITKNNEIESFLVNAAIIPYENEQAFLVVLSDITERKKADQKLLEKMSEVERLNRLFIGREERMIELKREVNSLLEKQGKPKKYETPDKIERRQGSRIQGSGDSGVADSSKNG